MKDFNHYIKAGNANLDSGGVRDREIKATLKLTEGPEAFDIQFTIRKNPDWIQHNGTDAYELELEGIQVWTGPTPGYCLDKAMLTLRTFQDDAIRETRAWEIEQAERKAGWDPNP